MDAVTEWASLRGQYVYKTIAGVCAYHKALVQLGIREGVSRVALILDLSDLLTSIFRIRLQDARFFFDYSRGWCVSHENCVLFFS